MTFDEFWKKEEGLFRGAVVTGNTKDAARLAFIAGEASAIARMEVVISNAINQTAKILK
jgi:hypothetical protein